MSITARCPRCKGSGRKDQDQPAGPENICPRCKGSGKINVEGVTSRVRGILFLLLFITAMTCWGLGIFGSASGWFLVAGWGAVLAMMIMIIRRRA